MSEDTNNGDYWKYEVDTVQRDGLTARTLSRRHGEVSYPDASDGKAPNDQHDEGGDGFDSLGIPTGDF